MKRRYGTGGLYQPKGQSTWVIYFQHEGKRVRESTHTDNYNVALGLLKRKVGDVSRGDYIGIEIEKLTITDLWEPYKVGRRCARSQAWRACACTTFDVRR